MIRERQERRSPLIKNSLPDTKTSSKKLLIHFSANPNLAYT